MSQNSLEKAHENISNVIYQAILNPHFNKETIVQVCDASKQNGFAGMSQLLIASGVGTLLIMASGAALQSTGSLIKK